MKKKTRASDDAGQRASRPSELELERRRKYGITQAEVDALIAAQGGRCAICRVRDASSVDHCHATSRVRAMLCRSCNAGLGLFGDDPKLMRAAAAYLAKSQ